jgi:hypothetical protein
MSLALTTTHENTAIFRGVVMSLGTPRRMKMPFITAPPQSRSRDSLQRARSEVIFYLVPRACRELDPDIRTRDFQRTAISGDLLSAVVSTCYILGFRKDNPNVFNMLVQNLPHSSGIKCICY